MCLSSSSAVATAPCRKRLTNQQQTTPCGPFVGACMPPVAICERGVDSQTSRIGRIDDLRGRVARADGLVEFEPASDEPPAMDFRDLLRWTAHGAEIRKPFFAHDEANRFATERRRSGLIYERLRGSRDGISPAAVQKTGRRSTPVSCAAPASERKGPEPSTPQPGPHSSPTPFRCRRPRTTRASQCESGAALAAVSVTHASA
jgi:hypothetical protein